MIVSAMSLISATKPPRPAFSASDAAGFAQELYGITATARELPSERDQNFHLQCAGEQFVLKISNAVESREVLDFQNQALARLAERGLAAFCPRVRAAKSGELIAAVKHADGRAHLARLLSYLPGAFLAHVNPHTPELLYSLGHLFGRMDDALAGFSHPAMQRELKWDSKHAAALIKRDLGGITDPARRAIVAQLLAQFETAVAPILPHLRQSVIHNDGNDHNILVSRDGARGQRVSGIIDFGDLVQTYTVSELAVASAYAMLEKADPVMAAAHIARGYHAAFPLTEPELAALFHFICLRLCLSVTISACQRQLEPDNDYLVISEKPAWALLEKLVSVNPPVAHYTFRHACGLPPCPNTEAVVNWLADHREQFGPVLELDLKTARKLFFDFSVGSRELALTDPSDTAVFTGSLFGRIEAAGAAVGIGQYNEARQLYTSDIFKAEESGMQEWRTVHLGIDLFMPAGAPVCAPLDGVIHSFRDNAGRLDYGPTIILEHQANEGRIKFFTLYGHLSADSLKGLHPGQPVKKGARLARIGDYPINGDWPPHLHFQIMTDLLGKEGEFPGVALNSRRDVWLSICPDPNLILGIPEEDFPASGLRREEILQLRRQHLGSSLSLSYQQPLQIVRGWMQYLYDDTGRAYLDAVNNVPHVGHCHPRVVKAAQEQMAILNTNTRYLHENIVRYAERLCALLPDPLRVCFFVCSGSEANDLALRLARAHTKQRDVIVVDGAYHGNLTSLVEISPYKFDGPGGDGAPAQVHKVAMPDVYRGAHKASDPQAGEQYARHVARALAQLQRQGKTPAAFICESLLGCGGQIVLPDNYLKEAYRHTREAGGVCIADEVQVGFGRIGSHFWGFEAQGVVPDIVTLGKPIGNGHPMAAVVTTPEIAAAFANGMEYFNTYGGNPVSCAVGLAVLDVIAEEGLQQRARAVGAHLKAGLERLMAKHPLIGDVRGLGLFLGIELVTDRASLAPAAAQAAYIVERMKEEGILLSTDGPLHNVLKIKPPLVFSQANADFLVSALDRILAEDPLKLDG
jgi:4-aminobutyrate aminotransferase-like enzyme/Ser/Thr protein kinase RdoA (MazF antagonist)